MAVQQLIEKTLSIEKGYDKAYLDKPTTGLFLPVQRIHNTQKLQ